MDNLVRFLQLACVLAAVTFGVLSYNEPKHANDPWEAASIGAIIAAVVIEVVDP